MPYYTYLLTYLFAVPDVPFCSINPAKTITGVDIIIAPPLLYMKAT